MKAWAKRVALGLVLVMVGFALGHFSPTAVKAEGVFAVPKAYGHFVGTLANQVVFEASDGTLRLVSIQTGMVAEQITRN